MTLIRIHTNVHAYSELFFLKRSYVKDVAFQIKNEVDENERDATFSNFLTDIFGREKIILWNFSAEKILNSSSLL